MSKFRNMKLRTKVAIGASAVAVSVLGGGAALAFFTSGTSGTGSATTGSSTSWTLSQTGSTGPSMTPDLCGNNLDTLCTASDAPFPGTTAQTKTYSVTNSGGTTQTLTNVAISFANSS